MAQGGKLDPESRHQIGRGVGCGGLSPGSSPADKGFESVVSSPQHGKGEALATSDVSTF